METITAADLFCGAGGTSNGLWQACQELGAKLELFAINHWNVAISTHSANHPFATHLCTEIDNVNPRILVPSGRLNLLVASPECTHHSNARGGKPMNEQSRANAWAILRWAEALYIDSIIVENVREFRDWGPLGANGRPLRSKRGETFLAFIMALQSLGYKVEYRILNCADYGDPTTRERLFVMARRGNKKVVWPEPTHGDDPLFGNLKPWRSAREIIDWSIEGKSIFSRKRPLAPTTLARIEAGLRRFGGKKAEPFLVVLRNHGTALSIDGPVPTLTAKGNHVGLCEPFVIGQQSGATPRSVEEPLPTIAGAGAISLIEPFIVPQFSEGAPRSVDRPLGAITTTSRGVGLVEPFIMRVNHGAGPGERDPHSRRVDSIDEPLSTVTATRGHALVEPFLVKYNGTGKARPISEPLDTVTSKDRFGLVETEDGPVKIDIRFRMLRPRELARAMSFGDDFEFSGNRELQVKQIGNAVPVKTARALCLAALRR